MNVSPTISAPLLQGAAQAATGEAVRAREFVSAKAIDPVVAAHQAALAKSGEKEAAGRTKKKKPSDDVKDLNDENSSLEDLAALAGAGITMSNETLIDAQTSDLMAEALEVARLGGYSELTGTEAVSLSQIPLVILLEAQDSYDAVSSVLDETPKSLYFKCK